MRADFGKEDYPYPLARTVIPHGWSDKDFKNMLRRIEEQGMPTINRRSRREGQRVGDAARRAKAKRVSVDHRARSRRF